MKKLTIILLALVASVLTSAAQNASYRILSESDYTAKAKLGGSFSFGSREVKLVVYDYPSTDADGKAVTISGVIMIPTNILDGSVPCDGVVMYNHYTVGSPDDVPSKCGKGLNDISALVANPLRPNYIIVACDYIGYGSSADHMVSYISGDTNSRNALDGLLAARQFFKDRDIPQGKYLFNVGFSQGGTVSMFAAKLTDTEKKYKDIRFDKTFSGGGPLDFEKIYSAYVERDACEDLADVVMMLISVNENYHLGIDYKDMFLEPVASKALDYFKTKDKSVIGEVGVLSMDSIHQVLTPTFMNLESEPAQKLLAKLKEISLTTGWEPDTTKNYYIEHSRHDNYVPIQSVRGIIPWMKEKGFKPSIVPGKSSLQTCTVVFKLKHQQSGIVWAIQTMAAIQFWPVLYYEGEQNRYFRDVVGDMDLMKVIKIIESWGIDLKKVVNEGGFARNRANIFDLIPNIGETLGKVGLTTDDLQEMLDDSGIDLLMLARVYSYLKLGVDPMNPDGARATDPDFDEDNLEERIEGPLYLLRNYEQTLTNWFQLAGYDVNYNLWGL